MAKKKRDSKAGRWAAVGVTEVTQSWKSVHAADEHLIYVLDTASGDIVACGDVTGVRTGIGRTAGDSLVTLPTSSRSKRKRTS